MKKSFILLPLLACAALTAEEDTAAQSVVAAKMTQELKPAPCVTKPTAVDPSPCLMRGDDFVANMSTTGNSLPAGYNYPANVLLSDGWDVYGDVSYILWYAMEDGLDLASSGYIYDSELWQPATKNGKLIFQDADYTSGFKVGVGANLNVDDWTVDLTYTYLRQETHTNPGPAPAVPGETTPAYNVSGWFVGNYYGGQDVATNFDSKWKMHLDWLDLQFSRPYYQGRRLVVMPSAGLRASWIRQQLRLYSPNVRNAYEFTTPNPNTSSNYSGSWAIGPRSLIEMHWIAGAGFRFQGNVGASLLFTQYTSVSHREGNVYDGATLSGGVQTGFTNYNCLRPMTEANLGVGWGMYLDHKKYHIDLSATYDFNYLWAQNMMRYLAAATEFGNSAAPGDLVLHGLDLKARFDF